MLFSALLLIARAPWTRARSLGPSAHAAGEPGIEPSGGEGEGTAPAGAGSEGGGGEYGGLETGRRGRRCRLSLSASASRLTAGETPVLSGRLECPSEEAAGRTVTIEQHSAGLHGFRAVGTAITGPEGEFHFLGAALSANSSFRARAQGARAARAAVRVLPAITLAAPPPDAPLLPRSRAGAALSRSVTFSGVLTPARSGTVVLLQRQSPAGERWWTIARAVTSADGSYSITHTFTRPGPASVRVLVRARGLSPAVSAALTYDVAPRRRARITIAASAPQLSYGQPVTISGQAAAGPGTTLTLLAHVGGGRPVAIARTVAGVEGDYSFPPQTPLQSTSYRVRGPRGDSGTLRENVQPLLTLRAVALALATGQTLQLCGTVTPGEPGAVVLLQRALEGGVGYRTVSQTVLGATAEFCLESPPLKRGGVYRVRLVRAGAVPGAVASPLTVSVQSTAALS